MKLSDIINTIIEYRASERTRNEVNEIFTQGDNRYLDPEAEAFVAGFLDNNAIKIEMEKINNVAVKTDGIRGPQKEMKAIVISLLKEKGYEIVSIEKGFMGGIPDVLAKKADKTIAVECGPCAIIKAIDYLENDNTNLWILKPENVGYVLYNINRSHFWDKFIKFHRSRQFEKAKPYIEKAFSKRRKIPRILSYEEISVMFAFSDKKIRDNMLLKCMYFLGLRNSEVKSLNVDDIDTINGTVKVVQGKGKKDRYVPIPGDFSEELKRFIKDRKGFLFTGRSKGRLSDRHIRRIVKKHAKSANVRKYEEIHPHSLRHSYATHLQNAGVPLNIIKNMLGHERIETTAIYTHMGVEKAREWVEKAFKIKYTLK